MRMAVAVSMQTDGNVDSRAKGRRRKDCNRDKMFAITHEKKGQLKRVAVGREQREIGTEN